MVERGDSRTVSEKGDKNAMPSLIFLGFSMLSLSLGTAIGRREDRPPVAGVRFSSGAA